MTGVDSGVGPSTAMPWFRPVGELRILDQLGHPTGTSDPPPDTVHLGSAFAFPDQSTPDVTDVLVSAGNKAVVCLDPNIRPSHLKDARPGMSTVRTDCRLHDEINTILGLGPSLVALSRGAKALLAARMTQVGIPSADTYCGHHRRRDAS
ncbi:hypothetical protein AB4Y67_13740 [Arthrobacter sp. YAF17]|uniref:hypothetical protein n=1 Tax=Arthrobacter sp. YAF17 TaxID=3233077 RepID=UPI003F8FDC34